MIDFTNYIKIETDKVSYVEFNDGTLFALKKIRTEVYQPCYSYDNGYTWHDYDIQITQTTYERERIYPAGDYIVAAHSYRDGHLYIFKPDGNCEHIIYPEEGSQSSPISNGCRVFENSGNKVFFVYRRGRTTSSRYEYIFYRYYFNSKESVEFYRESHGDPNEYPNVSIYVTESELFFCHDSKLYLYNNMDNTYRQYLLPFVYEESIPDEYNFRYNNVNAAYMIDEELYLCCTCRTPYSNPDIYNLCICKFNNNNFDVIVKKGDASWFSDFKYIKNKFYNGIFFTIEYSSFWLYFFDIEKGEIINQNLNVSARSVNDIGCEQLKAGGRNLYYTEEGGKNWVRASGDFSNIPNEYIILSNGDWACDNAIYRFTVKDSGIRIKMDNNIIRLRAFNVNDVRKIDGLNRIHCINSSGEEVILYDSKKPQVNKQHLAYSIDGETRYIYSI
jgi:hypothetical protein